MDESSYYKLIINLKSNEFENILRDPKRWKFLALKLKHAADRLYEHGFDAFYNWKKYVNSDDENMILLEGDKVYDEEFLFTYDMEIIPIYYLLIGFAFENLLKAILIERTLKKEEKPITKFPNLLKDHDLLNLCNKARINLENEEEVLLKDISDYIIWEGRYPIPLNKQEFTPKKRADGTIKYSGGLVDSYADQIKVNKLFSKLISYLSENNLN